MTDFLESKLKEIDTRISRLRPQVEEYQRLKNAADALANIPEPTIIKPARRAKRPTTTKNNVPIKQVKSSTQPAGRPKGSGQRAAQAIALVTSQPGITIPELAVKMGIKQNYLYRVLPDLQQQGKVTRQEDGWHPTGK
jgi:hypothetical protein